jgi:L-asparaginase II
MMQSDKVHPWGTAAARLITVTRGEEADTVHTGTACLSDARGDILWSLGDVEDRAFLRSSAKPLQAMPVITTGAAEAFGLDEQDLAILCGSHTGGPEQIAQVSGILAKCRLTGNALACGTGLSDMCSGKHAGMLVGCQHLGLPLDQYLDPNHPWQQYILASICDHAGLEPREVHLSEDGCSAPTYSLPLFNMALSFARLAKSATASSASQRLLHSMYTYPGGHTGEPDLKPFSDAGEIVTKAGVNGVFCAALPTLGLGFALKVTDGSSLPHWPVFTEALFRAGLISESTKNRMYQILVTKITTRQGRIAGSIHLEF